MSAVGEKWLRDSQPNARDEQLIIELRQTLALEAAVGHDDFLSGPPTKAGIRWAATPRRATVSP